VRQRLRKTPEQQVCLAAREMQMMLVLLFAGLALSQAQRCGKLHNLHCKICQRLIKELDTSRSY